MRKKFFQKYHAFSLPELMIVITIIGVMSAVLFASLTSNRSTSRLKTAQREVASTIKLAQTYALQGLSQGATMPCGYGFWFTSDTAYEIFYNQGPFCEKKNSGSDPVYQRNHLRHRGDSVVVNSYTLKNGVRRTQPADQDTQVYFTIPHANMYDRQGNEYVASHPTGQDFTFDLSGTAKDITVNPGGYVTEDP